VPSSCALLGGFAIGARVSLLWQHRAECEMSAIVCTRYMPGLLSLRTAALLIQVFTLICVYFKASPVRSVQTVRLNIGSHKLRGSTF